MSIFTVKEVSVIRKYITIEPNLKKDGKIKFSKYGIRENPECLEYVHKT